MTTGVASRVPSDRVRDLNEAPIRRDGKYVLYWMIASRRTTWNFALDRAIELARELDRPLIVLEGLRAGYRWACDRFHRFVIDGMADNARAFEGTGIVYHPYVEPKPGAGEGLLETLSRDACAVITDDYPAFFLPRMTAAAAEKIGVRVEGVDSSGLFPMRATDRLFHRAYDFRRYLQRELAPHLEHLPNADPLATRLPSRKRLPAGVGERWPRVSQALLDGSADELAQLPIDHDVVVCDVGGGAIAAGEQLERFLKGGLDRYGADRNHPDADGSSRLAPYLHFGHLSAHAIFAAMCDREGWNLDQLSGSKSGKRTGWWGMSEPAEAFLDQLVTWRELGFNFCAHHDAYDRYESLPDWARLTLDQHRADRRPHLYTRDQFEFAETHDDLWNAAQCQLRAEGRIHNYLRMLWGKKILHWSETPQEALETMIDLNNKYAIDGRDPNSYSGIFWVLGRFDRAWGPERDVFGKIRYMSSDNTRRKLHLRDYVARWQ